MAHAPRAARLAGRRVPRRRLGRQAHGQADGDVGRPTARIAGSAPRLRELDPANRWLAAQIAAPARRRVRPRQCPGDRRAAQPGDRRAERQAVPAGRLLRDPPVSRPRPTSPTRDDRQYRRGLYTHWQRTFLHPMLANFDAPAARNARPSRTVANTPQQALTLLNDPTFVEAARVLAATLLDEPAGSDAERIDACSCTGPGPPAEAGGAETSLAAFLATDAARLPRRPATTRRSCSSVGLAPTADGLDRAELAAWTERLPRRPEPPRDHHPILRTASHDAALRSRRLSSMSLNRRTFLGPLGAAAWGASPWPDLLGPRGACRAGNAGAAGPSDGRASSTRRTFRPRPSGSSTSAWPAGRRSSRLRLEARAEAARRPAVPGVVHQGPAARPAPERRCSRPAGRSDEVPEARRSRARRSPTCSRTSPGSPTTSASSARCRPSRSITTRPTRS